MKPNIVWITLDACRPDHLSFNGYKRETTPFLDSLARRSVYFDHAYSTGPGSSVSFVGMFTSTYPLDYGGYTFLDRPRVLLPEALQEAGYTTIGIHSSPYLSSYFGYGKGWDTFLYLNYFAKPKTAASSKTTPAATAAAAEPVMSPGLKRGTAKANVLKKSGATRKWLNENIPPIGFMYGWAEKLTLFIRKVIKDAIKFRPAFFVAEEVNAKVNEALDEGYGGPTFLWVHYLDAHVPYGLYGRKGHGLKRKLQFYLSDWAAFLFNDHPRFHKLFKPVHESIYDASLRYMDGYIEQLFGSLEARGIVNDDTIIIVNADHGEEFWDHGDYGHLQRLYNANIRVPLIVHVPGMEPKVIGKPVSLIDLAPTMLDLAGGKRPETYKGDNLFKEPAREVVTQASESAGNLTDAAFTGISMVYDGYKLIHWKGKKMLFKVEDEAEGRDLYNEKGDVVRDLEARLKKYEPKNS